MKRAFILLLDSFGIGATDDAATFNDQGADTFGHICVACANGNADDDQRQGPLRIPNLNRLGLNAAYMDCHGQPALGLPIVKPEAMYGYASEISTGKDTPSGHWEIAGVPVSFDWGYFPNGFPQMLINKFINEAGIPGILGNCHASGTEIIKQFGTQHLESHKPIVYTSGDSVFQIAAHEEKFGLQRLYRICEVARRLVDDYNVGRVIARPFLCDKTGEYYRTGNRRDYATPPPSPTLLDKLVDAQGDVIAIGKISDIYAHQGISKSIKANGNMALFDVTLDIARHHIKDKSLIFTNFVDFDSKYGHRRNVKGYAKALESFDCKLPLLKATLQPDDIVVITADHGCDPTFPGSDHTREYIPVLAFGSKIKPKALGRRSTFADIGQSLAHFFGIPPLEIGTSFL